MQGTFINLRPMFWEYEFISALSLEVRVCASTDIKIDNFIKNPPKRCYYCKYALFTKIKEIAKILKQKQNTINSKLTRARKKLKEIMEVEYE